MNKYLNIALFLICLVAAGAHAQEIKTTGDDSTQIARDSILTEKKEAADTLTELRKIEAGNVWTFGLNGGYAYRLPNAGTRSNNPYSRYLKKMKTGFSIGADVHRFFWKHVALGLKYNIYKSAGDFDTKNADNISINFIGPSVQYQSPFENEKTSVIAGFAMGYQSYKNKGKAAAKDFTLKGNATGWAVTVGLEQKLNEHLAMNLSGACYLGTSYKFRRKESGATETIKLTREQFEELSRVEITLGLKFLK